MRILARVPNWLGDGVMCLPALEILGRIGDLLVHATAGAAGVFRAAGHAVEEIAPGFSFRAIGSVRRARPDLCVLFTHSFSSAAVAALGRAPRRVGYPWYARRWLLTHAVEPIDPRPHQIDEFMHIAEAAARVAGRSGAAAIRRGPVAAIPRIVPSPVEVERWRTRLAAGAPAPTVGVAPGAAYGPAKRWPAARYADAVRRLAAVGRRVVLVGSPADRAVADEILAATGALTNVVDLVGRTRVDDLPALLAALDGLVTNDSGAAHVAAAVGTPVVSIFGPTDPRRTAPRGPRARFVWGEVECAPCELRRCPIDHRCMARVAPADVLEALEGLAEPAPAAAS